MLLSRAMAIAVEGIIVLQSDFWSLFPSCVCIWSGFASLIMTGHISWSATYTSGSTNGVSYCADVRPSAIWDSCWTTEPVQRGVACIEFVQFCDGIVSRSCGIVFFTCLNGVMFAAVDGITGRMGVNFAGGVEMA